MTALLPVELDEPTAVALARAGDESGFDALVERYRAQIVNFLFTKCGDRATAEDLAQDTFLKAWLAIEQTTPDLKTGAWLHRIAFNRFLDHARHVRLVRFEPADNYFLAMHPSQWGPDTASASVLRDEGAAEVRAVLAAMRPHYARLIELREFEDCSYAELAERAGLTWAAAKSMLFRARDEFVHTAKALGLKPFGYDPADAPVRRLGGVK